MVIKIVGLIIIVASFAFILKSPDKSMVDRLMERKKKDGQQAVEGQKGRPAEEVSGPDSAQDSTKE